MQLRPESLDQLRNLLRDAHARRERIDGWDLGALDRLVAHVPEDMTVTVEAGCTLGALQRRLRQCGQWVPLDPPGADMLPIERLLALDATGPRRHGHGTVREHVIGLKVLLADGRLIHSGGRVVKNVAGFDLMKLFVGAEGSLGIIVEATFKLLPLPEHEQFVQRRCETLPEAGSVIEAVFASPVTPVVFDLQRTSLKSAPTVVLGFAGVREAVEWQLADSARLGVTEPTTLEYDEAFRSRPTSRRSVLPSRLIDVVASLGETPFVARAGIGVIYLPHEAGTPRPARESAVERLVTRTKETFDPHRQLPEVPS